MQRFEFYIGIDISADDFAVSILTALDMPIVSTETFTMNTEGFEHFLRWLEFFNVHTKNSLLCMEATGVYGEALCYFLAEQNWCLAVDPPLNVKRAFYPTGHKNDRVDSKQIAEYAYRYQDRLYIWSPRKQIVEQVALLLTTREHLVKQKTASTNALHSLDRKVVKNNIAYTVLLDQIGQATKQIKQIEQEIMRLINQDTRFKHFMSLIKSVPGISFLFSANMLVITNGFVKHLEYEKLAAMIGICPYQFRSGSSIYKKDKSAGYGPPRLRKLLHLAARSVKTHKEPFKIYEARKKQQGKINKVIINNIANKLLRIICAIIKEQKQYDPSYVSINPLLLKKA